jgi:hypothetical protein
MQNPKDLAGSWLYRSFVSNANPEEGPKLFGQGILNIQESDFGHIVADFDFGEGMQMKVKGTINFGDPFHLRLQGRGLEGTATANWVYDYNGFLVPDWMESVNQMPSIIGSVIRTEPHDQAKAGVVASFIMLKMN